MHRNRPAESSIHCGGQQTCLTLPETSDLVYPRTTYATDGMVYARLANYEALEKLLSVQRDEPRLTDEPWFREVRETISRTTGLSQPHLVYISRDGSYFYRALRTFEYQVLRQYAPPPPGTVFDRPNVFLLTDVGRIYNSPSFAHYQGLPIAATDAELKLPVFFCSIWEDTSGFSFVLGEMDDPGSAE